MIEDIDKNQVIRVLWSELIVARFFTYSVWCASLFYKIYLGTSASDFTLLYVYMNCIQIANREYIYKKKKRSYQLRNSVTTLLALRRCLTDNHHVAIQQLSLHYAREIYKNNFSPSSNELSLDNSALINISSFYVTNIQVSTEHLSTIETNRVVRSTQSTSDLGKNTVNLSTTFLLLLQLVAFVV